ncbi:hypothetical protein WA556_003019 [Blastocystis sp. ATCC 50177/Nand II]
MKEQCPSLQPKETKEYADNQYWDDRYKKSGDDDFEWYYDYETLKDVFDKYFDRNVLVVGCGNSNLCEDLAKQHQGRIVGTDISTTVIDEMKRRHAKNKEAAESLADVEYLISNITENGFDHAFDVVVDKGTFDALLCGGMEVAGKCFMNSEYPNDSIGEGSLILISHVSNLDEMQELLSELVTMLDWEEFKYSAHYAGNDNPAIYVFNKVKRVAGEAFDATEDMNNVEITLENYGDEDMEEEEDDDEEDMDDDDEYVEEDDDYVDEEECPVC